MLQYLVTAICILIAGALLSWAARMKAGASAYIGAFSTTLAGCIGLYSSVMCLLGQSIENRTRLWNAPYASLKIGIDPLTSFFLIPIFLIGALVSIHAYKRSAGDYSASRPHEFWLFLNLTLAGAAGVALARNAVLFLFAWEIMTVASFLLVENTQRQPGARSGGWVYLTAGHLGCAALFAMFALMGSGRILDFNHLQATGSLMSAVFILGCIGFGGKIGLAPLQTWYPEPYPQAPAHAGAILSGVVGNMGVYGLLRLLSILGGNETETLPRWWGFLLLASGLASGLIGAARSLASRDLSRLLAWSSVENYGLIVSGIGMGLIGAAGGNGVASYLGFAAAIYHTLNHAVAKSLLFITASNVYSRTGTRNMDTMGGLMHCLPLTGTLFLIGSLGAACVPPLNGFVSEFLLLMSAFNGATGFHHRATIAASSMFLAIVLIAVIGCLAVAAYCKAFGFVFLGNRRGPGAASKSPERRFSLIPNILLAVVALALSAFSPRVLSVIGPTAKYFVSHWRHSPTGNLDLELWLSSNDTSSLDSAFAGIWLITGCVALVYLIRRFFIKGKNNQTAPTWDCGYAAPDSRMQYTASSFSRPLAENFQFLVNLFNRETPPQGLFPTQKASFSSDTPKVDQALGFSQLFRFINRIASRFHALQIGRVQIYLLYMAIVLVILLIWKL